MKNTLLSILMFLFYAGSLSATNDITITTQDIVYNSDGTTTSGLITIIFNDQSYLPVIVDVEDGTCQQPDQTIFPGEIYTLENSFTASCAGEYCFTIYSGILTEDLEDDCIIEICATINVVCEDDLISLNQIVDCICSIQESLQAFELSVSGQNTPYTYQWSGPNNFTSTQQSPLITESGDYSVTITNAIGCERIESINIPVCSSFEVEVVTIPSCNNQATGEATAYAFGEYPPFTFEWSNGETVAHTIYLAEGAHSLTVTDGKDCQIVKRFEISTSPAISILSLPTVFDCAGEGQASITPGVISGTAPFSYLWSNGQTAATATNLTSGNYSVTITDNLGCSEPFDFMLDIGQPPTVTHTLTDAHCKNNDGGILLNIQSPGNHSIEWSDGQMPNQPVRDGLRAGDYWVIIRNIDGCSTTAYFTIDAIETPDELWAGVNIGLVTEAATQDYCNGSIEVVLGGTLGPYNVGLTAPDGEILQVYQGVNNTVLFEDLCATEEGAFYTIEIVDVYGCSIEKSVAIKLCSLTITLEEFIRPNTTQSDDGSITVGIAENYDEVEYTWSNGVIGTTISDLPSGTYTVTAREKNGCMGTRTFEVDGCLKLIYEEDAIGHLLVIGEERNYADFEIIILGGLFLEGQEETPIVALLREEGNVSFTSEFSSEYTILWRSVDQSIVGENINPIIISSDFGSGFSPRWIELTVGNGCISKTIQHPVFECGLGNQEEAANFFVAGEVRPCTGSNNGEILLAIPNFFNSSIEVLYGNEGLPIDIQSDGLLGNIAIIDGLSAGDHQFIITIDGCENSFVYSLEEAPVDEERLNYDPITHTCIYQQFCEGNPLGQRIQEPRLDPMNGTKNPCLVPLMCGDEKVWDKPYDKRTCRGIEYTSLLAAMVTNGGFVPPFTNAYLNSQGNVSDCKWVKYCTGNMVQISKWGIGGQAHFNGITNSGCSKWKCTGFLIPNIRSCPGDDCNQPPNYILDPDDAPTNNVCTRYESFNLFGLITAYRNGWLDEADGFSVSSLKNELERLSLLSIEELLPANCAIAIFCAEDFTLYYHNMEDINCENVLIPTSTSTSGDDVWFDGLPSIPDYDLEPIITCVAIPDQTVIDPATGNIIQEVIRCGKPDCGQFGGSLSFLSDCTTTQIVNYQELFDIFGIQPFVADPVQGLSRFDDPFLVEKIVRLNTLNFQDFTIPKLILATPQGRAFYDYTPGEGVQSKTLVEGLAYQIEDWDTGQSLIALTNEIGGYRLIYEDSLHTWDQLIYSPQDTNFLIKNISFQAQRDEIQVSGLVNGDLYVRQSLVASFESSSFFTLILSLDGDVIDFVAAHNFNREDIKGASFSKEGDIVFTGKISTEGGTVKIGEEFIHPPIEGKEQIVAFYNNTTGSFDLIKRIGLSENTRIIKSAVGNQGNFGFLVENADALYLENDQRPTLNESIGKSMIASFSTEEQLGWHQTIEGADFSVNDLVYLPDNSLFVAITFQDEIQIGNTILQSAGGYDIALIQFSETGELIYRQTYGTIEDETIEKLFFNGKVMFFAGEFWGNIEEREIGEQHFIDYTPYNNEVYISYINLENHGGGIINLENNDPLFTNINSLKAYPNPFKNTFNLELNAPQDDNITIEVVDLLGRLVFQQEEKATKGFNQFEIKMKDIPSSQLLNVVVRFKSGEKQSMQTRLIRE